MTAEEIRNRRLEKGWSQKQLAKEVGVSRQTVSNIENGRYSRYREMYERIEAVLKKNESRTG